MAVPDQPSKDGLFLDDPGVKGDVGGRGHIVPSEARISAFPQPDRAVSFLEQVAQGNQVDRVIAVDNSSIALKISRWASL